MSPSPIFPRSVCHWHPAYHFCLRRFSFSVITVSLGLLGTVSIFARQPPIDREALVRRHNIETTRPSASEPLQVGNGEFAFGVDATGLQTSCGNTLAQWAWHSLPLPEGMRVEDFKPTELPLSNGRRVPYSISATGQKELYNWLRENPHRLNLGRLILHLDGRPPTVGDLHSYHQKLDLWSGVVTTSYELGGQPVRVETCVHPTLDAVGVRIDSPLIASGRLSVELAFPYGAANTSCADWMSPLRHETTMALRGENRADFARSLDNDHYAASLIWSGAASLKETAPHTFVLSGSGGPLELVCAFAPKPISEPLPSLGKLADENASHWAKFWRSGGAIDLSHSKDERWRELERRIVLSLYLLAVNEAGSLPPAESGLYNNSGWSGRFHLEMHWWHGVHYALWNRWPLLERSLGWYQRALPSAREIARTQGYAGARWPKVGPEGHEFPSSIGPLLIWQEPHPIYYANLDYRLHPSRETLEKWRAVVFESAAFMASYAMPDKQTGGYALEGPLKTVPENNDVKIRNPIFELVYWRFGLEVAQQWRERLGLPRDPQWDAVIRGLPPLPTQDGVYLFSENATDTYTRLNWEHPSLIGIKGMLPGDGVDPMTMRATVRKVMETWQWDKCWGWDFPMTAMAAARSGEPKLAIDALLYSSPKNGFDARGLSSGGPFPYFPSNGGLLTAVAMMAAGWDGAPARHAPGFPCDGSWDVRWEDLHPMP